MILDVLQRRRWCGALCILATGVLCAMGGCPVDWDALTTDLVSAALDSVSTSLVDALSTYLAGN